MIPILYCVVATITRSKMASIDLNLKRMWASARVISATVVTAIIHNNSCRVERSLYSYNMEDRDIYRVPYRTREMSPVNTCYILQGVHRRRGRGHHSIYNLRSVYCSAFTNEFDYTVCKCP